MKLSDYTKDELIEKYWLAMSENLDEEASKKLFQTPPCNPSEGEAAKEFRRIWEIKTKERIIQDIKTVLFNKPMNIKLNPGLAFPMFSSIKGIDKCWKHSCENKSTEVIELGDLGDVFVCTEHLEETIKELNEGNGKGLIEVTYPEKE